MGKSILMAVLVLSVFTTSALAGDIGVGVMVGEPTGLSLKIWSGDQTAFDVAAGWSLGSQDRINVHADYLWHRYELDLDVRGALPYYFGVGGRVLLHEGDDSRIGVRVPLGLNYITQDRRFGFFIEVAPVIDLVPDTDFDLTGGLGARFYF